MKKRLLAVLLGAAMITGGISASAAEIVNVKEESSLPMIQAELSSEMASVLEMSMKSGAYSTMLVQTDTYDKLELHFTDHTILMDTQTGNPVLESDIQKGDKVYVYYSSAIQRSYPGQTNVKAVLTNLDDSYAPAHLLTVESIQYNEDGSITVLTENGGTLVTIPKDMEIRPLAVRNIVALDDIHIGTQFFAWYDMVAMSLPGQATAEKVVLPPQQDSSFMTVVEDDMVVANGRIQDGIAMVPVRSAAEALGYTVTWNQENQSINLVKGTVQATVYVGEDNYSCPSEVNGENERISLGTAVVKENGVSWVPAELFSMMGELIELKESTLYLGGSNQSETYPGAE